MRSRTHCSQCGARLPWIPVTAVATAPVVLQSTDPVKMWSFWAGEPQKKSTIAAGLTDFYPTQWCFGADKLSGVALDESAQILCLLRVVGDQLHRRLFAYHDILGSEVVEDGYIVSSTSGSAGSGRGGQGSLPQGLSQRLRTGETIGLLAFKLVLNAIANSSETGTPDTLIHIVKFICKPTTRGSSAHQAALDKADHWHRLILAFLHIEDLKNRPLPRGTR